MNARFFKVCAAAVLAIGLSTVSIAAPASFSASVGCSGSRAIGRLPNFIRAAISGNRALVAVRLEPRIAML